MERYKPIWSDSSIDRLFEVVCHRLTLAPAVDTGHWQAKKDTPMSHTRELSNVVFELPIGGTPGAWASWMKPNLPWAEDHFRERVSGIPYNPPPSHEYWPFNQNSNKDHMAGEVFSHTYPERMWPRRANPEQLAEEQGKAGFTPSEVDARLGIRYSYGDLANAIDLLVQEPHTRQCYIPIWFPEDLHAAAVEQQRVPCTLGYHIMLRDGNLNVFYPIRSLDWLRYARDDFYMAGRLAHWAIEKCRENVGENSLWHEARTGILTVHAVSLHCFEGDIQGIRHRLSKKAQRGVTV